MVFAQPANDNCSAGSTINLGAGNFGIGVFTSTTYDMTMATKELTENFHSTLVSAGNDKKSIWYKFTLPTARGIRVELKQPGNAIATADAGFTTFLSSTCLPPLSAITPAKLTPINKFGSTFNPCLAPGEYLVQVSSKAAANGPVYLEVTTSLPGVTNQYDFPTTAQNLGTLTPAGTGWQSFDVGCQTIENAAETCPALVSSASYTQSTWHVFTTQAAIDFLRLQMRKVGGASFNVGYSLYQGDIRTAPGVNPWSSLSLIDGCRSVTGGTAQIDYMCQLLPATTYSIQIFHHKDSMYTFQLDFDVVGAGQTKSPLTASAPYMAPSMQMGTLTSSPGGSVYTRSDVWGCNAKMDINPCPAVKPAAGFTYSGINYQLNDWITFTTTSATNLQIITNSGCMSLYGRLYTGDVNNSCALTLFSDFLGQTDIFCLPAGTYSFQTLGRLGATNPFDCNTSHLAQTLSIQLRLTTVVNNNTFNFTNVGAAVNQINGLTALPDGAQVFSASDLFGCTNTILPTDKCGGAATVKASYRILTIGDSDGDGFADSGFLTVGGKSNNFQYKVYRGDVRSFAPGTYPTTFAPNASFVDISGCLGQYPDFRTCVYPGIYTIVTFADANDVANSDQIWVRFDKLQSQFNLSAATGRIEKINASGPTLVNLITNTTYNSTLDRFDCNQTVRPTGTLCSATIDRCIYRVFKVGAQGIITINGTWPNQYMLYAGDASTYAGPFTYPNTVGGLTAVTSCFTYTNTLCVTPGIYTLVTQGDGNSAGVSDQPSIYYKALVSQFNLAALNRVNKINNNVALTNGVSYTSAYDLFDCNQTVLPAGALCNSADRAIYRTFTIGSNGYIYIYGTCGNTYKLYSGDANALATNYTYPNTIPGLTALTGCFGGSCYGGYVSAQVCLTPGTYTLVTFGNSSSPNVGDQPTVQFNNLNTLFDDPTAGRFNAMGNMNNGGTGTVDYFSCLDNPRTIGGIAPCNSATKQIYREFILTQPTYLSISGGNGIHTLFTGWASEAGGYANLALFNPAGGSDGFYGVRNWQCFYSQSTTPCNKLPAGKYTVVSYGSNSNLGQTDNITITKIADPTPPVYQNPGQAYVAGNVNWNTAGDGVAYPNTKRSYTFGTNFFDCSRNLPGIVNGCTPLAPGPANANPPHQGSAFNRTAYYTFNLQSEAYIRIQDIPSSMRVQVYPLDVRTSDSTLLSSTAPVQDCITRQDLYMGFYCPTLIGEIELCKMQPRVWTIVIYATDDHIGQSVTPRITLEKVETSRFDHASTAYDFGNVPGDNTLRFGRVGDVNPINGGRAASNDFFTCTTGARRLDPGRSAYYTAGARTLDPYGACWTGQYPAYNPVTGDTSSIPYPMGNNYALFNDPTQIDTTLPPLRRNLWYTFTVTGGGNVSVQVLNRTASENNQVPFSIYKSDVNGTLTYVSIAGTANNDSTLAMGLTYVGNNVAPYYYCCANQTTVNFSRDACLSGTDRYYIVVDHNIYNELNNQVEVGVQFQSISTTGTNYDFYSWANQLTNSTGQAANGPLGTIPLSYGMYRGFRSNFLCRTNSPASDQAACAPRSIWYVLDVGVSGRMRVNYGYPTGFGSDTTYNANEMVLYRQTGADSTFANMQKLTPNSIWANGRTWGEVCVTPGRYYIMMTGCSYNNDTIQPQAWILGRPVVHDFYSQAGQIGVGTLTNGTYTTADTSTFACATRSVPDPTNGIACAQRTLWYKFTVGTTGKIRISYNIIGSGFAFDPSNAKLYYNTVLGDSTGPEMIEQSLNTISAGGQNWGETCMRPGNYVVLLTGCWYTTEDVFPKIQLIEEPGDYCTNPIAISLNNGGSSSGAATVDCHTIGEAFGEDGTNMGCLFGPSGYKSTWFRVDFSAALKYDMTFQLSESTSALPNQIRYRVMYGTCGAMTAGPCNTDALTQFTLNCMSTGSYYVQVITPASATGSVSFTVSTVVAPDQLCVPLNPALPIANFTVASSCETDSVYFDNQSSQGADITYFWDFGVVSLTNDTSNLKSPAYKYPLTGVVTTYNVKLVVTNNANGLKDSVTVPVTVYPKPNANITSLPVVIIGGSPSDWFSNATNTIVSPATTYLWNFGPQAVPTSSTLQNPTGIVFNALGTNLVTCTVSNGLCSFIDTLIFVVGTEPIYNGGPKDGASMGEMITPCSIEQIWAGGPFDGANMGEIASPCSIEQIWAGGPFDGANMGEIASPCYIEQIWTGGPFDGANMGEIASPCINEQIWAGGPFDGADANDAFVNLVPSIAGYAICAGQSLTLTANYTGSGTPTFTYAWYNNNVLIVGQTTNTLTVSPATTTNYRVSMTQSPAGVCNDSLEASFSVAVFPANLADAGPDQSICGLGSVTIGTPTVPTAIYSWSPSTGLSDPNIAQPIANPLSTTTYTLTVTTLGSSCPPVTDDVIVNVATPPTILAGNDTSACFPGSVNLTASGGNTYVWRVGAAALTNTVLVNPLANANFTGSTFFAGSPYQNAKTSSSGWRANVNNTSQYLQIDLGASRPLHGIGTIGSGAGAWVTSYQISYTDETVPTTWTYYREGGAIRTFVGNVDAFTTVNRSFANLFRARHVRIHPVAWSTNIHMRVELYTDNTLLSINNPYSATAANSYIVFGQSTTCPNIFTDTLNVTNSALAKLMWRTRQNGNWTTTSVWQVFQGGSWVNAETVTCPVLTYPTSADSTIQVRDSVYYNLTIAAGIDEVTIDSVTAHNSVSGGLIHIPTGITLNMVDVSGSLTPADIQNNGVINIIGTFAPVGAGLLVNDDNSSVRYLANGNQTMWNGQYGKLVAGTSGNKLVGGTTTKVRTNTRFQTAYIELANRSITLDTLCTISDASFTSGYFVTNGLGSVRKVKLDSNVPFDFPVGPNTTSLNRATLTNSGTSDTYGVRVTPSFDFDPNFPADELTTITSVNRTWYLSETTPGGTNLGLRLHWITTHENASFDRTNSTIGEYNTTTGWDRLGVQLPAGGTGVYGTEWFQEYVGITNPQLYSVGSCTMTAMDYRTIANGNWTDLNIWEVLNPADGNWYAANLISTTCGSVSYPTSASRTILVRHNVLYDYSIPVGVDQLTINSAGRVRVPAANNFILKDGPGSDFIYPATSVNGIDLDNQGYFEITGTFTLDVSTSLLVNQALSTVEYNGGNQNMWAGSYAKLILTGSLPSAANLKNLTGSGTEVRENLTFANAKMNLLGFNCNMDNGAIVTGVSQNNGYMIATSAGHCEWDYVTGLNQTHTFPIGGVYYSPAVVKFDNVTTGGTLRGRVTETVHPLRTYSIKRYWTITQATILFSGSYTASLTYSDFDLPSIPSTLPEEAAMVEIAGIYNPAYTQPGGWRLSPIDIPYTQDLVNNTGIVINDAFSDFTFFPTEQPLPASNLLLTGNWLRENGQLNWRTDLEVNCKSYILERSLDNQFFEPIYETNAQGTTSGPTSYTFIDSALSQIQAETYYYRVRQIDNDGNEKLSNVVELQDVPQGINMITVYPNPVKSNNTLYVKYTMQNEENVKLVMYDAIGKRLIDQNFPWNKGNGQIEVPIFDITSGMYQLVIEGNNWTKVVKVIIEK